MKKYIYYAVGAIAIFLAGMFVGGKSVPPKTITKEVEVVKKDKDVKTVIKRVKTPDGTVTTEITKEDKSKETTAKSNEKVINNEKQWKASAFTTLKQDLYGATIGRRIVGPIFVDAGVIKNQNDIYGVIGVSIEF